MKRIFIRIAVIISAFLISLIAFSLGSYIYSVSEENLSDTKLPIIMYHHILKEKGKLGKFVISPDEFEEDLKYLKSEGYETITADALIRYKEENEPLPEKPVMLTFDDGYLSYAEYALPLLEKYGFCAVVSVVGAYTDEYTKNNDRCVSYAYMNWEDIKSLSDSKNTEIQNHTYDMHKISGGRQGCAKMKGENKEKYQKIFYEDVKKMRDLIYENTGKQANCFTYPFGFMCSEAEEEIKKMGFKMSLSCAEGLNFINQDSSLFKLKRFNREHNRPIRKILEGKK
ncbi:MAG: polysaccharide deacetylase family protein [Clostridia bacterium]|nr:polysaccharide deacetylase family protein [Clostridia bacterium]